ncbi:hypothetical protein CAEBREN_30423, partial [Caenorhabditis brenneri]
MKKVKKERNGKSVGPVEPVSYNRSILAAFEKQSRGKICPICNVKFSLASYKTHMNSCKVADDDDEVEVLASYTREEAVLMRAGPAIVLEEEESYSEKSENPPKKRRSGEIELEVTKVTEAASTSERIESEAFHFDVPGPSGSDENLEVPSVSSEVTEIVENVERVIKSSPEWNNQRRRSTRLLQNSQNSQNKEIRNEAIKKESAKISEVIQAIENFENRIANSDHRWPYYMRYTVRILKRVISTEKFDGTYYSDDFWLPSDTITFYRFVDLLSESAKCLLVRLFIRKCGWYQLEKLEQKYPEIPNIEEAAVELTRWNFVSDDSSLKTLDDALRISDVTVLKNVAKKFKIDGNKNRQELIQSLKRFAQSQQSIFGGTGSVEVAILKSLRRARNLFESNDDFVDLFR